MKDSDQVNFMFSSSQKELQDNIAKRLKKSYTPIKVNVNGQWKDATDMIIASENENFKLRFSDAKLVLTGKFKDITYKKGGIS